MDEYIYEVLSKYYHALEVKGYMSYPHSQKLLVLIFYITFLTKDYRGILSKKDYCLIERALNCIYGTSCLIPYPDYKAMGCRLHLGDLTEMAQRLKSLEDTNVVKLLRDGEASDLSDVEVKIEED